VLITQLVSCNPTAQGIYCLQHQKIFTCTCACSCLQRTSPSRPCYQKGGRHSTITSAYDSAS